MQSQAATVGTALLIQDHLPKGALQHTAASPEKPVVTNDMPFTTLLSVQIAEWSNPVQTSANRILYKPVQSSRSKSPCLRNGHLLRFEPNITATSDFWLDSESITTKVCSQNGRNLESSAGPTCAGLAHARDYSCCIASEQKQQRGIGHCFP